MQEQSAIGLEQGCKNAPMKLVVGFNSVPFAECLSLTDIESLVTQGKTNLIKGMKSNSGNKFNAYIVMNDNAETFFEFDNRKPKRKYTFCFWDGIQREG